MTVAPTDIDHTAERDHRKLGRALDLFASAELVGAGLPLWLPDGAVIREQLEQFVLELEHAAGYQRVHTPVLGKRELYERSGHWQHFGDDMFPPSRSSRRCRRWVRGSDVRRNARCRSWA